MKLLFNYLCILTLSLSFSAFADSEGQSAEINAQLEAIAAHKKSYNGFDFNNFLTEEEQSSMHSSVVVAKRIRKAIDNLIDIKSISDISIAKLANGMIDVESVIDSGVTTKASLLGRFYIAKSEGIVSSEICGYIATLSEFKENIDIEIASGVFQTTKVNIFFNQFEENENESKLVDLSSINLSDLASIYNYYKSNKGIESIEELTSELAKASKNTDSIMIMNNN
jgi:hypothetical protein